MIGVIAKPEQNRAVREFFELFKTPWGFVSGERHYDVVICTKAPESELNAKVVILCGAGQFGNTWSSRFRHSTVRSSVMLVRGTERIPIYGECAAFEGPVSQGVVTEDKNQSVISAQRIGEQNVIRVGFDIFEETEHLLASGQPAGNARIPTLDLHIALVRELILSCGIPLVEIPPAPEGHDFMVCLTHDVDHPLLRHHKFDHTMFGFLQRALFGSVEKLAGGRLSVGQLLRNWVAAAKLPFVYLGLAKDFWADFDRYLEIERGMGTTFFVLPFRGVPGKTETGMAPQARAAQYGVGDILNQIGMTIAADGEVGLHGIDAWLESSRGKVERDEIARVTEASEIGVRMHWLYFNAASPRVLEAAGFSYDSTFGYNETVGYRAGTLQAFRPLAVEQLLEMPLHIMDTALFYPAYLGLSPAQAEEVAGKMASDAARFGGALTLNWHDRSIAPERLWDVPYENILGKLKAAGAWFPTASEAVAWFRKRRSASFQENENGSVTVRLDSAREDRLPGLRVRVHRPNASSGAGTAQKSSVDLPCRNGQEIGAAFAV